VVVAPKVDLAGLRPTSWSPDGRLVLDLAQERNGIYSVAPGKGDMPSPLLVNPKFGQQSGSVSPDGRWLAYLSFESGTNDVFVRPFPDVESGKWQVSSGGVLTETPRWSADGRTLYFVSGDVNAPVLMRARVQTAPTFAASAPERITNLPADGIVGEIAADGRVLMLMPADDKAAQLELNVILHWADDLARRLAAQ
jgi:hypothetical protein